MRKLIILFVLIFNCNVAFAVDLPNGETAARVLKDGDTINWGAIDGTGFTYGIAMVTPGVAHVTNTVVKNAGTGYMTDDGRHGDGRGIYVTGAGAILVVSHTMSQDNSEDGYRVDNGGKLILNGAFAKNNLKNGFLVGPGGTIEMTNSVSFDNLYGFMASNGFLKAGIWESYFYQNKNQGLRIHRGEEIAINGSYVYNNTSAGVTFGNLATGDFSGISVHGTKKVTVTNTEIYGNVSRGFFVGPAKTHSGHTTRVHIDGGKITENGDESVISLGDSVITIVGTTLDGKCYEEADRAGSGKVGIITVDGEAVTSGEDCP